MTQPYTPPADDGGHQGSFTRPGQDLAQPNSADPRDRMAAGSLWTGVKEQRPAVEGAALSGKREDWVAFRYVWKAQAMMLLMVLAFSGLALVGYLTGGH